MKRFVGAAVSSIVTLQKSNSPESWFRCVWRFFWDLFGVSAQSDLNCSCFPICGLLCFFLRCIDMHIEAQSSNQKKNPPAHSIKTQFLLGTTASNNDISFDNFAMARVFSHEVPGTEVALFLDEKSKTKQKRQERQFPVELRMVSSWNDVIDLFFCWEHGLQQDSFFGHKSIQRLDHRIPKMHGAHHTVHVMDRQEAVNDTAKVLLVNSEFPQKNAAKLIRFFEGQEKSRVLEYRIFFESGEKPTNYQNYRKQL